MPSTNTRGRNTATVVRVEATTAMNTSRVPVIAASSTPRPRSRALAMDSSTTIESSTTRPVASARPPSDMTFRLRPSWPMKKNVVMIETGNDSEMTKVLQPSRRNRKMIDAFDDDGEPRAPLRTEVREERARSLISRNQSPDIGFSQSINPYRGCEHGCVYCFARPSHAYLDLSPGLDFETKLFAKTNAAERLREELA